MLESKAKINDSDRKTRVFLSSFPSGFNPAFYGENLNNSHFNFGNNINGGQLIKKDGGLHYNGSPISSEGIVESMPNFNNMYGDEIIWTQNNVQPNQSNQGNSNNKFLNFDGNDYAKVPYTFSETTTIPGSYVNDTIDLNLIFQLVRGIGVISLLNIWGMTGTVEYMQPVQIGMVPGMDTTKV